MYFGTPHLPGFTHEIAFDSYAVGKNVRAARPNIVEVEAAYYGDDGRLLACESLDHLAAITPLRSDLPGPGLVMLRLGYGDALPFNVYGFVVHRATGDGVTYPVSPAVGWPETKVWLNRGMIPTGAPSKGWRHELFVGNPSRWAELRFKVIFYAGGHRRTLLRVLPPKASTFIAVETTACEIGIGDTTDAVGVVARNKPVVYAVGRNETTGAISFVEHLVTYPRTNFRIPAPEPRDISTQGSADPLDRVFCFCNGMTLGEALAHEREGHVGNYCAGCRDDLRFARRRLQASAGNASPLETPTI